MLASGRRKGFYREYMYFYEFNTPIDGNILYAIYDQYRNQKANAGDRWEKRHFCYD